MVFLGDIAFYMATLVFAAGIWMIHHSNHHDKENCKLLRTSGYIVTIVAILGALCTGYYWIKYFNQGVYAKPATQGMMMHSMMGRKGGQMCTPGMENCPMMDGGNQMMDKKSGTKSGDHEEHH